MKKILMIGGKSLSGKDTLASKLISVLPKAMILAFADEVKVHLHTAFGLSLDYLYGSEADKNRLSHLTWNGEQLSYRRAMQVFGSDICRSMDKDCWVRKAFNKIKSYDAKTYVISDLRLIDEYNYINNSGIVEGFDVRCVKLARTVKQGDIHESETQLDKMPDKCFDLIVPPDYNVEETFGLVSFHLSKWGYL